MKKSVSFEFSELEHRNFHRRQCLMYARQRHTVTMSETTEDVINRMQDLILFLAADFVDLVKCAMNASISVGIIIVDNLCITSVALNVALFAMNALIIISEKIVTHRLACAVCRVLIARMFKWNHDLSLKIEKNKTTSLEIQLTQLV